jgi:hypothetical protein
MSHNFTAVTLSCLKRSVTAEARVGIRIHQFGICDVTEFQYKVFPPGCFHSPRHYPYTNATYLRYIIAQFSTVFNKSMCLCLCQYYQKNPDSRLLLCIQKFPDSYQGLKICTSLRLQRRNWYIFILLSISIVVTPSFLW